MYSGTVWEQYFPYVRTQETGNKTDVRWIAVYNDNGTGLMAIGQPLLSASAHQFLNEDLRYIPKTNRHGKLLEPRWDVVTLNIDDKQSGISCFAKHTCISIHYGFLIIHVGARKLTQQSLEIIFPTKAYRLFPYKCSGDCFIYTPSLEINANFSLLT